MQNGLQSMQIGYDQQLDFGALAFLLQYHILPYDPVTRCVCVSSVLVCYTNIGLMVVRYSKPNCSNANSHSYVYGNGQFIPSFDTTGALIDMNVVYDLCSKNWFLKGQSVAPLSLYHLLFLLLLWLQLYLI